MEKEATLEFDFEAIKSEYRSLVEQIKKAANTPEMKDKDTFWALDEESREIFQDIYQIERKLMENPSFSFEKKQELIRELVKIRRSLIQSECRMEEEINANLDLRLTWAKVPEEIEMKQMLNEWVYIMAARFLCSNPESVQNATVETFLLLDKEIDKLVKKYDTKIDHIMASAGCANCQRAEEYGCGYSDKYYSICNTSIGLSNYRKERDEIKKLKELIGERFSPDFSREAVEFKISKHKKKLTSKFHDSFYDGFVAFKQEAHNYYTLIQKIDAFLSGPAYKYEKKASDEDIEKIQKAAQRRIKYGDRKVSAAEEKKLFFGTDFRGYFLCKLLDKFLFDKEKPNARFFLNFGKDIFDNVQEILQFLMKLNIIIITQKKQQLKDNDF